LPIQLVISSLSRETSQATSLAAKGCIVSEQLPSISETYLAISNSSVVGGLSSEPFSKSVNEIQKRL